LQTFTREIIPETVRCFLVLRVDEIRCKPMNHRMFESCFVTVGCRKP
jgi:hypothetical protein